MKKYLLLFLILLIIFIPNVKANSLSCTSNLSNGSRGTEVKNLQNMLNKTMGCNLIEDGIFGKDTKSCVIKFQNKYNLGTDGIVGPITCKKLNSLLGTNNQSIGNNNSKATVSASVVNVRKGPSTSYGIVTSVNRGTVVDIVSKSNNWYMVKLSNGKTGYIREDLLSIGVYNYTNNSINYNNVLSSGEAIVIGDYVNVRSGASTSYGTVTSVKRGTKVTILSINNNWYKIRLSNNKTGYIRNDLVSKSLIIVDISDQRLYYSSNGNMILNVPVVTGTKGSTDTPIGNYVLRSYNKRTNQTLRGSYGQAYVNYWMPFIGNSIGFHDASWRSNSDYNKSTYTYNGSHGCVNMQYSDARILYNNLNNDTAVIVRN